MLLHPLIITDIPNDKHEMSSHYKWYAYDAMLKFCCVTFSGIAYLLCGLVVAQDW